MLMTTYVYPTIYKYIMKYGFMYGNKKIIEGNDLEGWFKVAYEYIIFQMNKRLPPKPNNAGYYPLWAYKNNRYDYNDDYLGYWARQQYRVKIVFDINPSLVLLSDYDNYHYGLNNQPFVDMDDIDVNDPNYDKIYRKRRDHYKKYKSVRRTWSAIFSDKYVNDNSRTVQGTFWVLTKEMILYAKYLYPSTPTYM